ncbi:MAG: hypothetical protein INH00_18320 [Rhodocyclaceae bacterium]|nr:hypothetical protein [Rhodocyclaceae bacterium]
MTDPLIVDADEGAALLRVSPRAFADLRKREGFPLPVALFGPRNPRWRVAELVQWVQSLPALKEMDAPFHLIQGKRRKNIERALRNPVIGVTR